MQACRYALEVVAKHPIYLLVYVGFLSLMGLFITSGVYPPATSAGLRVGRGALRGDRSGSKRLIALGGGVSRRAGNVGRGGR